MNHPQHAVAVIGGAVAGAEVARALADKGAYVAVFEQNRRPFGKIEDGLPRWHGALRQAEFQKIKEKLSHERIDFVPLTKVGSDIPFKALVEEWGFSLVVLACGAWRDRRLPVENADAYLGRGLHYQNPFIIAFNRAEAPIPLAAGGGIVIGGGLASIDVAKVLMLDAVRFALAERGIEVDLEELEKAGIPKTLELHGLTWEQLGLPGATLFYRREAEDMPLLEMPPDADQARREKVARTRRRALEKAMGKFLFGFEPLCRPEAILEEEGRLCGVRFRRLRKDENGKLQATETCFERRAPLVVSSIGSIPEPIPGVRMEGELIAFEGDVLPRLQGYSHVFSAGNVVTGKGNIIASRRHASAVATELLETFMGLREGHQGEEVLIQDIEAAAAQQAEKVKQVIEQLEAPSPEALARARHLVRERMDAVHYSGDVESWLSSAANKAQA
ncbi:MAG: hypothetical protein ACFB9M_13935 [Myxococcota bacterium]